MMTPSAASRRGRYRVYLDPIECGRDDEPHNARPHLVYRRISGHEQIAYYDSLEALTRDDCSSAGKADALARLALMGLVGHGSLINLETEKPIDADTAIDKDTLLRVMNVTQLALVARLRVEAERLSAEGKDDSPSQLQSPAANCAEAAAAGTVSGNPVTSGVPRSSVRHAVGADAGNATGPGAGS